MLGYVVEPGPRRDEGTLINDQRPSFMSHIVVPAEKLAAVASLSQTVTAQQFFRPRRFAIREDPSQPEHDDESQLDNSRIRSIISGLS